MSRRTKRPLLLIAALVALVSPAPALAQIDLSTLADADGDGLVSRDEFTAFYALVWLVFAGGKTQVDIKQVNTGLRGAILSVLPKAQGMVERDQMLDAVPARYPDADKNKNGVVSLDEMKAWMATVMTIPSV